MAQKQRKAKPKTGTRVIQSVKLGPKWTYITMRVPTPKKLLSGTTRSKAKKK